MIIKKISIALFFLCSNSYAETKNPMISGSTGVYAQAPFQANSLTPKLKSGLEFGHNMVYADLTIGSIWINTPNYFMDYYQNQFEVGSFLNISKKWQIHMSYRLVTTDTNHLDALTYEFHEAFNLEQNGRLRDEYNLARIRTTENEYNDFKNSLMSKDVTIGLEYQVISKKTDKRAYSFVIGGSLMYIDGNGIFDRNSFDQSIYMNYGYRNRYHHFYGTLGLSFNDVLFLKEIEKVESSNKSRFMAGLGYGYSFLSNHELIIEGKAYEAAIKESETSGELNEPSFEFLLGYRYYYNNETALQFTAVENYINFDNSADISFQFALKHAF